MEKTTLSDQIGLHGEGFRYIEVKNVKQFIKDIEEYIELNRYLDGYTRLKVVPVESFIEWLKKRAGDKLT